MINDHIVLQLQFIYFSKHFKEYVI